MILLSAVWKGWAYKLNKVLKGWEGDYNSDKNEGAKAFRLAGPLFPGPWANLMTMETRTEGQENHRGREGRSDG